MAAPTAASGDTWPGLLSTASAARTISGGDGNDRLFGDDGADKIFGLGGDDFVSGGGGDDLVVGGSGADTLLGGLGDDTLRGKEDDDILSGGRGSDTVAGGAGQDRLLGGAGDDILRGGSEADIVLGGRGSDTLSGGFDADSLTGGRGADRFVYSNTSHSAATASGEFDEAAGDTINDFVSAAAPGDPAERDQIDLAEIEQAAGHKLSFSGTSAAAFGIWTSPSGADTILKIDTTGDAIADVAIRLKGAVVFSGADLAGDYVSPAAGTLLLSGFSDTGSSASDRVSSDREFTLVLSGNEAGSTSILQVSADNGVTWTTASASQSGLADGTYKFRAIVTDAAGNSSITAVETVVIDTTAHPGALSLSSFSDTGASAADGLSNDNTFSLSLSGSEVGSSAVFEVSTDNGVSWTATTALQAGLPDGTYQFRATVTDAAGNTAVTSVQIVTVDTTGPAAGTLSLTGFADGGASPSDGLSNDSTFSLSLSGNESGSTSVFEVSTDNGLTWSATASDQTGIADGTYQFRATVTDAAGNTSTTAVQTVTIDTVVNAGTLSLTGFSDIGTSSSDGVSNDNTFSLLLSGNDNGTSAVLEVSTDNGLNWTTTAADQTAIPDGTYKFRATVTDAAGNTATTAVQTVTIDTAAPTAGTLSLVGFTDTGASPSDGLSNDSTFSLSLSGNEQGSTAVFEVSTDNGQHWATTTVDQTTIADGTYKFRATVTDAAGNTSTTTVQTVTIDTSLNAGVLSLTGFSDNGSSSSDGVSNDNTFSLLLSGNDNGTSAVLQVSTDNGQNWTTTTADQTAIADGTYKFRAMVTDAAGNVATTAVQTVTIDTAAPTAGTLSLVDFIDTGASSSDGLSNDSTFSLSLSGNEQGASAVFEVSTDNGLHWDTTTANQTTIADGFYKFRATVTDAAGNTSTTAVQTVAIDATAPNAGALSLAGFTDTGFETTDKVSTDNAFRLNFSGFESGTERVYQVSTDNGQTWNTTTVNQSGLADGTYKFRAMVTDAAGNISTTPVKTVTIDALDPITALNPGGVCFVWSNGGELNELSFGDSDPDPLTNAGDLVIKVNGQTTTVPAYFGGSANSLSMNFAGGATYHGYTFAANTNYAIDTNSLMTYTARPLFPITVSGANPDNLAGTSGANLLFGNGASDTLSGGDGDDFLSGGAGADNLLGGNNNDVLDGGAGQDTYSGGAGADTFYLDSNALVIYDIVTDYSLAQGDVIDITDLFTVDAAGGETISDYVRYSQGQFAIDVDGAANGHLYKVVLQLSNLPTQIKILYTDNQSLSDLSIVI